MSSLTCKNCGLINFATATNCKRCDIALHDVLKEEDGVWQDQGLLVMRTNARLDDYCIRCNSAEVVTRRWVTASSYAHWKLLLIVFGWPIIPSRLMAKLFTKLEIQVSLCRKHKSNWSHDLKINLPLILFGIGLLVLSFYQGSIGMLLLGISLFAIGCLSSLIGGDPLRLKRHDGSFIWLSGASRNYLMKLPRWPAKRS